MVVSYHVCARNWIQVLYKSNECTRPLSHLSSPRLLSKMFAEVHLMASGAGLMQLLTKGIMLIFLLAIYQYFYMKIA